MEDTNIIIETEVVKPLPSFSEGLVGTIVKAEKVITAVRGFRGVRVTVKGEDGNEYAEMLWMRETVGSKSKIGAFINALGRDLSKWAGKKIRIVAWRPRDREVVVVK